MKSLLIKVIVLLGLVAAIGGYVWQRENQLNTARTALKEANDHASALQDQLDQAKTNERIVVRYVDRVRVVHEVGKTIEKRIPVYVTEQANVRCVLPVGFVSVHNAAAQGLPLGEPAGDPDAPAAGLTLAAVADTVTGNYTTCHEIRETAAGLQAYVESLKKHGK